VAVCRSWHITRIHGPRWDRCSFRMTDNVRPNQVSSRSVFWSFTEKTHAPVVYRNHFFCGVLSIRWRASSWWTLLWDQVSRMRVIPKATMLETTLLLYKSKPFWIRWPQPSFDVLMFEWRTLCVDYCTMRAWLCSGSPIIHSTFRILSTLLEIHMLERWFHLLHKTFHKV
jgi:hypothetical protein